MASADVLFTALEDYSPVLEETFFVQHPFFNAVFENGNFETISLEGTSKTFGIYTDGPGQINKIVNGSEFINGGRKSIGVKGEEHATRAIYAFDVPNVDLDLANGAQDIVKLLEKYPEAGMMDFQMQVARQLVAGDASEVGIRGITTLNGGSTAGGLSSYTPETTAKTGLFAWEDKATQAATVHGIVKEGGTGGATGWYNQYGDISAFGTDGLRIMRKVLFAARRQGKVQGSLDLGFADELSYLNLLDEYQQFVDLPKAIDNDVIDQKARDHILFHTVKLFLEEDIEVDPTDASTTDPYTGTAADDGLIYFINSKTWKFFHASHNKYDGKGKPNIFRMREPFRHPTQDMMRFEILLHGNLYCNNLRANGAVTGGAA